MLGPKKYEFEQLVAEILPKIKALNKFGMKIDCPLTMKQSSSLAAEKSCSSLSSG